MRRLYILSLLAMMIAWGIGGCGSGGTSADPLGTDSLMFGDATGSVVIQLNPNGAVALKATVTSAYGKAVAGREVTLSFVSNASGASLTSYNANTNGAGEATILYRAGATAGSDVVRASISNGAKMDVNITVGSPTGAGGRQITLTGAPTSLTAGQNSILSARVTDQTGSAVSGQVVAFRFVGGATLSGGAISAPLNGGITDASGQVVAIYTAGSLTPTVGVQDVVEAYITGAASDAVIITRTASTAVPPAGYRLTIAADVTSLAADQNAVVTVTVTDGAGNPAGGQAVTFVLFSDTSGATLNTLNGTATNTTDVSGKVVAIYTAGPNSPTLSVQDTVQASITGATGAIVMTRTAAAAPAPTGVRMTVTATPTSLIAGAMSVIVAQVNNSDGTPAAGLSVTFSIVPNNSGALPLTPLTGGVTDASGTAIATYTAGNNSPGLSIQDAVSASVTGSAGAAIITRLAATGTGNRISLTLTPVGILPTTTSNCIVQATVLRDDGVTPVANEPVTFSIITGGGAYQPLLTPTVTVTTNNSGEANAVFTAPGGPTGFEAVVRAEIFGTTNGGDAVGIIYW